MVRCKLSCALWLAITASVFAQEAPLTEPVRVVGREQYRYANAVMGGVEYATGIVSPARQPARLFIRADGGGVWKLDRAADRWNCLTDNIPFAWRDLITVDSVAVHPDDPDIIYLAGGGRWGALHDVLKTEDGGKTWQRLNVTNAAGRPVANDGNGENKQAGERLVIDINSPNIIYYATRNDGLLVSRDAGKTWSQIDSLPTKGKAWAGLTFVMPHFAGGRPGEPTQRLVVGVQPDRSKRILGGIFITDDAGATWKRVEDGPATEHWTAVPMRARIARDGTIYLTNVGGVWKMPGGKGTWENITPSSAKGKHFCGVNLHPTDASTLIVAETGNQSESRFYYSNDAGENWRRYQYAKDESASNVNLSQYPAWELADGRPNWGGNASDVAFDPIDPKRVWHTSFSGPSRIDGVGGSEVTASLVGAGREQITCAEVVSPSAGAPLISGVWDVGGFRHASLDQIPETRLRRQEPDGSWHREAWRRAYQDIFDIDVQPDNPNHVVLAGGWQWNQSGEAAYSQDNAQTFRPFPSKPFPDAKFGRVAIGMNSDNVVWIPMGQATSSAYYTKDNGQTWKQCDGAPLGLVATEGVWSFYRCLAADRILHGVFYIYDRRDGKFYRSADGGATFDHRATLPKQQGVHFDWHRLEAAPYTENDVWLSLRDGGLLRSSDGGATWSRLAGIQWAENFAFGKPRRDGDYPAIYMFGQIGGEKPISTTVDCRLYRSDDEGRTWVQLSDDTLQFGTIAAGMAGDMQTYGRVFISTTARGIFYGEPAADRD